MRKLVFKSLYYFLIFFALGCSATKQNSSKSYLSENLISGSDSHEYQDTFVTLIKPKWFDTVERFTLRDENNQMMSHRFFDVSPGLNPHKKTAHVIITTPEGSLYGHDLDLTSGQFYTNRKFCSQKDASKRFQQTIERPPFSIGVVPRVLDQLNKPQKIIVFGERDYFNKYYQTHFFEVRLIGAYVEQICPTAGCLRNEQWLSRMVLVAVQNGNRQFESVVNLNELRKKVDWDYVRAFIENGFGSNFVSGNFYQGYRMGAEVTAGQALAFLNKNSTIFTIKRLSQIRLSCYKLYDYLWKDLSYRSADEIVAKDFQEIRAKAIKLSQTLGKKRSEIQPFYKRYIKDFKKFHEEYKTCVKYIAPSSINDSPERHWFFSYLTAFHKLHELGYFFDCKTSKWDLNPYVAENIRAVELKDQFKNCSDRNIDIAITDAVTMLENLRKKGRKSYRYIDYDRDETGSHAKVYAWVPVDGKRSSCQQKDDRDYINNKSSFPVDIKWKKRGKLGKTKSNLGEIIY